PSGFARDQRLKGDRAQQVGLGNLRFDNGSAHGEDRLAVEENRAFGNCEEIAGEVEFVQVVEELGGDTSELGERPEICDFFWREAKIEQVIDNLGKTRGDDEVAILR